MLTLIHTHAGGTLLEGTSRGDGSADVLKSRPAGSYWRWSRNIGDGGAWYIPQSRDHLPRRHVIEAVATALRRAGFDVEVDVDDTSRPIAEVVEGKLDRLASRADALEARAERKAGEAAAHRAASDAISDGIPTGQPILVGHHSERRHRRDLERMHARDVKSWEAADAAKAAARSAEIAARAASGKEAPLDSRQPGQEGGG